MPEVIGQNPEIENEVLLEQLLSVCGELLDEETMDDLAEIGGFGDTLGVAYGFLLETGMETDEIEQLLKERGILED